MARLGLLPVEIELGRWHGIEQAERLCQFGCGTVRDSYYIRHDCETLSAATMAAKSNALMFWRKTARMVECRRRKRTRGLRA